MSFYSQVFTVPKNTPTTAPYTETFRVVTGILNQIAIIVAPGHAGLTGCAIDRGLHQIAPVSGSEWFSGDDSMYNYPEYIEIRSDQTDLTLRGYNLDDTYNHAFIVTVSVLPSWVVLPAELIDESVEGLADILREIAGFLTPPEEA